MKYQSELMKEIVDKRGHKKSSIHQVSGTGVNPLGIFEVPVEAITQNLSSFIGEE